MTDWINKAIMGLLLSALVSCAGYIVYLRIEVSNLNETISDQIGIIDGNKLVIDRYAENEAKTAQLVKEFQISFNKLKEAQDAKAKQIEEAMNQARGVIQEYESYSASILATTPKSSNMCKEADDLINSYLARERSGK